MCLRLLRAELWAGATHDRGERRLHRVTARIVPGDMLRVPAVLGHIRVVVTGAEGTRLHEEVVVAGGTIEGGKLVRANEDDLRSWLGRLVRGTATATRSPSTSPSCGPSWPARSPASRATGRATRRRSLATLIESRCTEEVAGHDTRSSTSLSSPSASRWTTPRAGSRPASSRSTPNASSSARTTTLSTSALPSIPATREQETAALRRRYADPQARWFPAAITFLVPAAIAKGADAPRPDAAGAERSDFETTERARGDGAAAKTIPQRHAEWVGLLRPDGPFIAVPVLTEAFPQYLDTVPDGTLDQAPPGLVRAHRGPRHADPGLGRPGARATCSATPRQSSPRAALSPLT